MDLVFQHEMQIRHISYPCTQMAVRVAVKVHNGFERQSTVHQKTILSGLSLDRVSIRR